MQNGTWAVLLSDQERLTLSCKLHFVSSTGRVINTHWRSTTVNALECAYTLNLCAALQERVQLP